jgi:hypothetical protein
MPPQGGNYPGQGPSQTYPGVRGSVQNYPGQPGGYPQYPGQQRPQNPQQPQQPATQQQQQPNAAADTTPAPPPAHVIEMTTADQTLYALPGDVIRLKGHFSDNGHPLDHSFLELDRGRSTNDINVAAEQIFDTSGGSVHVRPVDDATSDDYQFDWPAVAGDHYLRVGYVTSGRNKQYAQYAHVIVMDKSPFISDPKDLSSVDDLPVTLTLEHDAVMLAKKIDVYFDDKQVGSTVEGPPFQFTLPTGKATPGKHALRLEAYDANNGRFELSQLDGVDVPKRVTLDIPASFTMAKADDTITITPKLGTGFKPTKIEYYLKPATGDEKLAGKSEKEPFDAKLDLSTFPTGQYTVHSVSYTADGQFKSDDYPLALTNSYGEALAAKAAQEAAQKKDQQAETDAEQNAAAGLRDHPKLTWDQVNQKVTDTIANFLAARPGAGGKHWGLATVKHVRQPNQSQNVYLVAVIVNSPEMSGVHAIYSVDLDKNMVTDLQKTW